MKTFTRFFFAALLSSFAFAATAQTDMAVTNFLISNSGGNVPIDYSSPVIFYVANSGSTTVPTGTQFGVVVTKGTSTVVIGPKTFVFSSDFTPGDTVYGIIEDLYTFSEPHGNLENVCVTAFLPGGESDSLNNIFCKTFQIDSTLSDDVAVTEIELVNPAYEDVDGFEIDNNFYTPPVIQTLRFNFSNQSDLAFFRRPYSFDYSLNSTTETFDTTYLFTFGPDDTISMDLSNLNLPIPKVKGNYTLCVRVNEPNKVTNNDEACLSFTIKNTLVGIDDANSNPVNILITSDYLALVGEYSGKVDMDLIDMTGKVVASQSVVVGEKIDISKFSAGTYVISYRSQNENVSGVEKFVKQ